MRPKIVFKKVTKSFNLYKKQSDKFKEIIFFKKAKNSFFALKNVSFEIYEGEAIGIVGLNGSGKSTLSNLFAQIIPPTSGSIEINGETSLIAISAGLNNQLTGLENIDLKCLMHGLKNEDIKRLKSQIIEFADIGDFIEQPVKNYSSGMKSRLGFAISIHTNPDILIVDEALSVGDQTFYQKCLDKINELKKQGKTIIFISHSISQIKSLSDRVMWIHYGRLQKFGETGDVLKDYAEFIKWFNSLSDAEKKKYKNKMRVEQLTKEEESVKIPPLRRGLSRKDNKSRIKEKGGTFFALQFLLLFFGAIISASIMFEPHPVQGIAKHFSNLLNEEKVLKESSNKNSSSKNQQANNMKEINQNGVVVSGNSNLYTETTLKMKKGKLSFSDIILVKKKINDLYMVQTSNDAIGYTKVKNVKIINENQLVNEKSIEVFLPLFPQNFTQSYQYFLAFLNGDSGELKSKIRGLTNEQEKDNGEKTFTFADYDTEYTVNKNNKIQSISISKINTDIDEWNQLKVSASFISNDNLYYCFITNKYKIVIDLAENRATISSIKLDNTILN